MPASRQQAERNSLLVERRKLVGREAWTVSMSDSRYAIHEVLLCMQDIVQVHATTSQTLKHQIELQRYREAGSIVTLRDVQRAEWLCQYYLEHPYSAAAPRLSPRLFVRKWAWIEDAGTLHSLSERQLAKQSGSGTSMNIH